MDDGRGLTDQGSATATVSNVPPTVTSAGGPYVGVEGSGIQFGASATDPGSADVLTSEWDFHYDGTTFDVEGTGASPTYAYPQGAIDLP